jgi:hypothetical protein
MRIPGRVETLHGYSLRTVGKGKVMQDLFGQDTTVYRGQPLITKAFTDEESERVLDDVVFEGMLLKQTAETLAKLKNLGESQAIGQVRRDAWEEFMWVFDLWATPAYVTFDTACSMVSADAEAIRGRISHTFAKEIRQMFDAVVAQHPEERGNLINRMRHYIDLTQHMH